LKALKLTRDKDYDLVFATSSRLFTAFLGSRIAKNKKIPLYLDIRDIFLDTVKDIISPIVLLPLSPLLSFFEKSSFGKANKINLVSKGFLNYFNSRYPNMSYSFYTNGIDKEFLGFDFHEIKEKSLNRKITVTYAGNIGEGQGLHKILPNLAIHLQDNVHFKIIGDGGKRSDIEEIISKKNIKNIELIAPMSRDGLKQEYKKSDLLFLHLNDYDAFKKVLPSKLFEYAATSKPIWAGLSGYSAEFCLSEIENCSVFKPSDYKNALLKFNCIDFHHTPRHQFIKKYKRENIMENMANDVMTTISKK
jgi:glycosyltransferase involved in cell wall biosynthesis